MGCSHEGSCVMVGAHPWCGHLTCSHSGYCLVELAYGTCLDQQRLMDLGATTGASSFAELTAPRIISVTT